MGAGFSGLGVAIRLDKQGVDDFVVFEKASDVGGTWQANTYPGARCDVPSQLYSYSFALNPRWTHSFSTQPEIQQYIRDVVDEFGIRDRVVLNCEVLGARWNADAAHWKITTTQGEFTADFAVSAAGPLSAPNLPDIKGISSFEGAVFHSARWDHSAELAGKRVAVVGTGASAIQIIPGIADTVGQLTVFQRTAPWVLPRVGHKYTAVERFAYQRIPGWQRLVRTAIYWLRESFVIWQAKIPLLAAFVGLVARGKIFLEIRDKELRAKVTPKYRLGCKRMLISNDYYGALSRPNVDVVTDGIHEIRANSIVTEDGSELPVDAIVFATGFRIEDSPTYDLITGRDGRTVAEVFEAEGISAYRGTALANFPNVFVMMGPNTALAYTSAIFTIESQINYIADAIAQLTERGLRTVEVRGDVQHSYDVALQRKYEGTVWTTGGCDSWFKDSTGKIHTLWPDFSFRFYRTLKHFDLDAYETT
nr:NAD(P)/FAD-dependent oxidoreductase [Nocardia camponoti]